PYEQAHNDNFQKAFNDKGFSYIKQWEIARVCSLPQISLQAEWIDELASIKAEDVAHYLLKKAGIPVESKLSDSKYSSAFAGEYAAQAPWAEFEREERELAKNPNGGLGCDMDDNLLCEDGWYGGNIHFTGRLKELTSDENVYLRLGGKGYSIQLDRPRLGTSCRFMRKYGSKRFLKIKVNDAQYGYGQQLANDFFKRPFVVSGCVFRSFYFRDGTVFMVQVNERLGRSEDGRRQVTPRLTSSPDSPPYFFQFTDGHNPMRLNSDQTMMKYVSRIALGLSNSVPGIAIRKENIQIIDDIITKPPSEMEMTDGCGLINHSGLRSIATRLGWDTVPTAIQCRVMGAKGLLLCCPPTMEGSMDDEPRIWLRKSQVKIKYGDDNADPANFIIDVLRKSHMTVQGRLSTETIMNLAQNNVPHKVLIDLMHDGIMNTAKSLTSCAGPDGDIQLWLNVARADGIFPARLARLVQGKARAMGYVFEVDDDGQEDEDGIDGVLGEGSVAWRPDEISGCPSTLGETAMGLLDSGFTPDSCHNLHDKLAAVRDKAVKSIVSRYQVHLTMCTTAWIVPDPHGVLKPGEIHFRSSSRNFMTPNGLTDTVEGGVLLARHPCKVASDIQKALAVYHPLLRNYVDVIVFNTTDYRSLASRLAGGDYDGDKCQVIWEPTIVDTFTNADENICSKPSNLRDNFLKDVTSVAEFLRNYESSNHDLCSSGIQDFLLAPLTSASLVGKYSTFHSNAVYRLGYNDPSTVRLAHMFCEILDGSKSGLKVRNDIYRRDKGTWDVRGPVWRESEETRKRVASGPQLNLKRAIREEFIMDKLFKLGEKIIVQIKTEAPVPSTLPDYHLTKPWLDYKQQAQKVLMAGWEGKWNDVQRIEEHVKQMKDKRSQTYAEQGRSFTELRIERRQDILRNLSLEFTSKPSISSFEDLHDAAYIARLKASCAYHLEPTKRFPWDVAFRELCAIKAQALGSSHTVTAKFYDRFVVKESSIRKAI
ncbi:hypothetical protein JAAARDRAFT_126352, partial [Jaapia argillacea MUCL 33604]